MADEKVAIVTGAGSGIGRATCELLAEAGYRLTLVGRTESTLRETMEIITAHHGEAPDMLVVTVDVTDEQQAGLVIERTMQQFGRVDALINNAGLAEVVPIEETDGGLLQRTFASNAFSTGYLIRAAWPVFREQGGGCVVNVSSMATIDPFPGFFAYAAAKAAVESMVRSVMNEGGVFGVRAFSVAPGAVETPMLRSCFTDDDLPPDRALDPREVGRVIAECVHGRRDDEVGRSIAVPSP
jgi:NAD(P)-dependent dehydrogenase (short-subunit alcohol dehydrogenase family)